MTCGHMVPVCLKGERGRNGGSPLISPGLTLGNVFDVQILIAKSPLAPFTSFVYTIEKEGLVLQGKILGGSPLFKPNVLRGAHCW